MFMFEICSIFLFPYFYFLWKLFSISQYPNVVLYEDIVYASSFYVFYLLGINLWKWFSKVLINTWKYFK